MQDHTVHLVLVYHLKDGLYHFIDTDVEVYSRIGLSHGIEKIVLVYVLH